MSGIVKSHPICGPSLLALFALGLSCEGVCAATAVAVKNDNPVSVQLGFDGAAAMTIAPRATARFSLNAGEHSAQCRFEGGYDGCNLDDRFTIGDANVSMSLRPLYRLQHAVALAQQGMLAVETRQDSTWATATLDVREPLPIAPIMKRENWAPSPNLCEPERRSTISVSPRRICAASNAR